ncbi:nucleoside-diphosphate kinase [Candidatus Woesearchaeota archaeon]|nr:MAG: nucleoside-diphosphate kinase [Candidatus Woesearchaeota archaeon]
MTIERTLVLLKPDAVQRGFMGEIITRFERAGLKMVGCKMVWADEERAKQHYREEDIVPRRGEKVWNVLLKGIREGPVLAFVLEGVHAIEIVRKMVGATEPKAAAPGTIRGDYAHVSFAHADAKGTHIKNLIHASANAADAATEIAVWFTPEELHSYRTVHDVHVVE